MITASPSAITTSSVVFGTVPQGHGASGVVELQFPEPVVVIAPHPICVKVKRERRVKRRICFFMISPLGYIN
jgi:hypothetical protein